MIIADFYEFAAPFREEDFIHGAAMLFHHLQFTEQVKYISRSLDVKRWVYNLLGYDVSITLEEVSAIENIKMAAELESVYISDDEGIRLFAIELQPWAKRSEVAYQIHKLFAKAVGDCSTILFAQEVNGVRSCLFSVDTGDNLILSDWFTEESDVQSFFNIDAAYLSSEDARSFQSDLAYAIGRSYYWRLDTPVLIYYDLLQYAERAYVQKDGTYDWTQLHADVEEIYLQPMKEYGDDYIPPALGDGKGDVEEFDITGELLDAEFEKNEDESFELEESPLEYTGSESTDEIDGLIEQLGEDFNDSGKLLKALQKLDTKQEEANSPSDTLQKPALKHSRNSEQPITKAVDPEIVPKKEVVPKKPVVQIQDIDVASNEKMIEETDLLEMETPSAEASNADVTIKPMTITTPEKIKDNDKVKVEEDLRESVSVDMKKTESDSLPKKENGSTPLQIKMKKRLEEISQIMTNLQNERKTKEDELQKLQNKKPKRAFGFARTVKKWYRNIFGKNSDGEREQLQAENQLKKEIEVLNWRISELGKEQSACLHAMKNE